MSISQVDSSIAAKAYESVKSSATDSVKKNTGKQSMKVWQSDYGSSIGDVKLSEKAASYYEELKSKFGNMNFILVSEDKKSAAENMSAAYASQDKLTVLIDTDKIEQMASDESVRAKYEGILSNAQSQMSGLSEQLGAVSDSIVGYGLKVNDDGTATYFAVLKDMSKKSAELRAEKAEKKAEEKKAAEKAEARKEREEALKGISENDESVDPSKLTTVSANSIEELIKKIEDYTYSAMSDNILSENEKYVGQQFDFSV